MLTETIEKIYTLEEYLQREERSMRKHEFFDGEIKPMPGAKFTHNLLATNIIAELHSALKSQKPRYHVLNSDMKIRIEDFNLVVYPDSLVICEKPSYFQDREDIITNPLVIVEVLSRSTEKFDRDDKFVYYRSLPSFREYILVSQQMHLVDTYYKERDDFWRLTPFEGLDKTVLFRSLNVEIPMTDIYRNVTLAKRRRR